MAKVISDSWVMAGVRNMKKSVAFYSKLGLKPSINRPYYVELNLPGGTVLGLHSIGAEEGKRPKAAKRMSDGGWGIMLRVKDLEKVVADLKRKRVKCGKIATAPGGADFASVHDPDGNRLVLVEMPSS
ncbi:MAG: VOC family protein [Candidatus Manganitrophus sp.]|nr:VOC family protein [Candidatus Manganitrophus sp.]WDT70478.1 MAG: VOC family protein [Candidatus Manganitrophus sp.]WDT82287.1 MAG: VOC family protein [Candidatus Manganitrophus sp.]